MPDYIAGRQSTGTVLQAERTVDIIPELFWLQKDLSPVLHLSAGGDGMGLPAKKRHTVNSKYDVLEKEPHGRWTAVNYSTGYTAGAVTFILDATVHINVGDVLKNVVKEEVVHVTGKDNSAKTVTVTRAFGATSAVTTWADNEPVLIVGSAHGENAAAPTPLQVKNRSRTNYTQIFRETFGLSRTAQNSEYYQGKKKPELRQEAWLKFKQKVEWAFTWGEPYEDLTGSPTDGEPIRQTGGIWYWAQNAGGNITTATTTFTKAMWTTFIRGAFETGDAMTKVALCAPLIIEMLDYWKDGKLQMRPSDHAYTLKVAEWETGNGTLLIIRDRKLQNSPAGTTTAGYGGVSIVLDPEFLQYRFLQESDAMLYENVIRDGRDGFTDEILGEIGLGLENPELISILEDVSTYA